MKTPLLHLLRSLLSFTMIMCVTVQAADTTSIDIGSRREQLVDKLLIDKSSGELRLVMHKPIPREISIIHDEPWEGNSCGYHTVFRDGDLYRMYYKCYQQILRGEPKPHKLVACYAESHDGNFQGLSHMDE